MRMDSAIGQIASRKSTLVDQIGASPFIERDGWGITMPVRNNRRLLLSSSSIILLTCLASVALSQVVSPPPTPAPQAPPPAPAPAATSQPAESPKETPPAAAPATTQQPAEAPKEPSSVPAPTAAPPAPQPSPPATESAPAPPPGAVPVPQVTVTPPPPAPAVRRIPQPAKSKPAATTPAAIRSPRGASSATAGTGQASTGALPSGQGAQPTEASIFAGRTAAFNEGRSNIFAPLGTAPSSINQKEIQALPLGDNAPLSDVLLQLPGVTKDSAATGSFHVRNEHAYVQYRINGIMLPDGLSSFGPILDTSLIGNLALITGALPAQYGLRSSAIIDITTRSGAFDNSGSVACIRRKPRDPENEL